MLAIILACLLAFCCPNLARAEELRSQEPLSNGMRANTPAPRTDSGGLVPATRNEQIRELPIKESRLTLEQCIAEALSRNPSLAAARHEIAAAKYDIVKKRGTTLPFVGAEVAGYEVNGSSVTPLAALNIFEPDNAVRFNRSAHWGPVATQSVGVNYPLFQYGSILGLNNPPVVAAAKAVYEGQKSQSLIAEQRAVFDVITAFSSAVWYTREGDLEQTLVDLDQKRLEIISDEVGLGLKLPQDAELARTQLEGSKQRLESSRENAREWKYQLAALLGRRSDQSPLVLDSAQPQLPPLPPLEQLLNQVMASHPALRVQGARVEVARQQYRIDHSTLLPTANMETSFTAAQDLDFFNGGPTHRRPTLFLSYLQIKMPLFDFGQRRAATHESEEKVEAEQARLKQVELDLSKAITQTYSELYDIDKSLSILQAAYVRAKDNLELVKAQRSEGIVDELSLVNARGSLFDAQVALESKELAKRLKYAQLQDLSGGTWHWVQ